MPETGPEVTPEGDELPVAPPDDVDVDAAAGGDRGRPRRACRTVRRPRPRRRARRIVPGVVGRQEQARRVGRHAADGPAGAARGRRPGGRSARSTSPGARGSWVVLNFFDPSAGRACRSIPSCSPSAPTPARWPRASSCTRSSTRRCPSRWPGSSPTTAGAGRSSTTATGRSPTRSASPRCPRRGSSTPTGSSSTAPFGPVTDQQLLGVRTALRTRESQ